MVTKQDLLVFALYYTVLMFRIQFQFNMSFLWTNEELLLQKGKPLYGSPGQTFMFLNHRHQASSKRQPIKQLKF
jgi:hypothetical protein